MLGDLRRRRRRPQQLQPLRRLRDRAAVLEPRDHRRPRRALADVQRRRPDLRLRDRRPRRHGAAARDGLLGPPQHPVPDAPRLRVAQRPGQEGPAADAAGDDQPRPDQRQPRHQQPRRRARPRHARGHRRGAGQLRARRDRQGVPDLHAAPGDVLGRGDDGDLPDAVAVRGPPRLRRPAADDGERDADDPARPRPGGGGDPRPVGADDPARLPARRVLPGGDAAGRHGAVLVRLLAAVQRALPDPDPDVLQPPAAVDADLDRRPQPRRSPPAPRSPSTSRSGSPGSSPGPRSPPPSASSPR